MLTIQGVPNLSRSAAIEGAGFLVIRFWNNDVLARIDAVMDEIDRALRDRSGASD